MSEPVQQLAPRLGAWGQSEEFVGVVAAVDEAEVTLFDPATRQAARVPHAALVTVPAGAVTVTVRLDLPLAHGLAEGDLRRWVAVLLDGVLRERAVAALAEAGLDEGAALPPVTVEVTAATGTDAVCLAGHRTPSSGAAIACPACGREAVPPPARQG